MRVTIECLTGSLAGRSFEFDQAQISLGRGESHDRKDLDFADTDSGVSRNHGKITVQDGTVRFHDHSRAGTLVGNRLVLDQSAELSPGDELRPGGQKGPLLRISFTALARSDTMFVASPQTLPPRVPPTQPMTVSQTDGFPTSLPPLKPVSSPPKDATVLQGNTPGSDATIIQPSVGRTDDATVIQSPATSPPPMDDATVYQLSEMPASPSDDATHWQGGLSSQPPAQDDATVFQGAPSKSGPAGSDDRTILQFSSSEGERTLIQPPGVPPVRPGQPVWVWVGVGCMLLIAAVAVLFWLPGR